MILLPAGRLTFFAKGGVARWRSEASIRHSMDNIAKRESDGVDPMYGAGLAWNIKGSTGVRLEYERIATDTFDRDFVSAGVHLKF